MRVMLKLPHVQVEICSLPFRIFATPVACFRNILIIILFTLGSKYHLFSGSWNSFVNMSATHGILSWMNLSVFLMLPRGLPLFQLTGTRSKARGFTTICQAVNKSAIRSPLGCEAGGRNSNVLYSMRVWISIRGRLAFGRDCPSWLMMPLPRNFDPTRRALWALISSLDG